MFAYEYNGYWKDVGTLSSYWQANMELIDLIPEFNLYEKYWKIYTKCDIIEPQYIAPEAVVEKSLIGEGSDIYGQVHSSVVGAGVTIGRGSVVRNSIIMKGVTIGENVTIDKGIIAEDSVIGDRVQIGFGEYAPNSYNPKVYASDLATIAEASVIPPDVRIGRNTAVAGVTTPDDYPDGQLAGGNVIIKEGESA